ncbi:hypothetical protein ACVXZ0_06280 [Staphylococcus aureus]
MIGGYQALLKFEDITYCKRYA